MWTVGRDHQGDLRLSVSNYVDISFKLFSVPFLMWGSKNNQYLYFLNIVYIRV